ncbi:MAG: trigger factor family protein [Bacteroidales bacterium]|nr:trigger factor family protein [Bacteroidales bacterium]
MEVKSKKIDVLNQELTINVLAADYVAIEKKKIAERKRTAEFKGFRKGMVPESLIRRVYGDQALADAVNEVVGSALESYITENKLNILGEPLASEKQPEVEWKTGNDFTFLFDIALSPEVNVDVVKEDSVPQYAITIAAKDKEKMAESLKKYYEEKKEEKSAEDIDKEVETRLADQYKQESEWRLTKDIRDYFVKKAALTLPEDFLKRWLFVANNGKFTKEDIEKEFAGFAEDFKWQMVRGFLMKKYELKVEDKDIQEAAEAFVAYQYAMYGIGNVPPEMIKEAAQNVFNDSKQVERLVEQVEDQKVLAKIKETITIKSKKISSEKFREL